MKRNLYHMCARVWLYPGEKAAWHFITLPQKESDDIKETCGKMHRGWGSIRVCATIGKTRWQTSIFPDRKSGAYILPLKAGVRKNENIQKGDTVLFTVEL